MIEYHPLQYYFNLEKMKINFFESHGLAVEHSGNDLKVVGLISVQSNARLKWCQSHARLMIAVAWLSSLML
jgi:hypothetical protein